MDDWYDVVGFPGYRVNRLGVVLGKRGEPIGTEKPNGYLKATLYDQTGKQRCKDVQCIVAERFIPNPNDLPCVDHIDGDPLNNNVENLRWLSRRDNCRYRHNMVNPKTGLPRGVTARKTLTGNRYIAQVVENKKTTHLGTFINVFDAELRRLNYEHRHWGPHLMIFERRLRRIIMNKVKAYREGCVPAA